MRIASPMITYRRAFYGVDTSTKAGADRGAQERGWSCADYIHADSLRFLSVEELRLDLQWRSVHGLLRRAVRDRSV